MYFLFAFLFFGTAEARTNIEHVNCVVSELEILGDFDNPEQYRDLVWGVLKSWRPDQTPKMVKTDGSIKATLSMDIKSRVCVAVLMLTHKKGTTMTQKLLPEGVSHQTNNCKQAVAGVLSQLGRCHVK